MLVGGALTDGGALIAWLDSLIGPEKMLLAQEKLMEVLAAQDEAFLETAPMMLPFFRSTYLPTSPPTPLFCFVLNLLPLPSISFCSDVVVSLVGIQL